MYPDMFILRYVFTPTLDLPISTAWGLNPVFTPPYLYPRWQGMNILNYFDLWQGKNIAGYEYCLNYFVLGYGRVCVQTL